MTWSRESFAQRPRLHGILLAVSLSDIVVSVWELATGHYRSKAAAIVFLVIGSVTFAVLATYAVLILRDRRRPQQGEPSRDAPRSGRGS